MNTIIAGFVGLLVIVAVVILGPVLAGSIEKATENSLHEDCSYTNSGGVVFYGECGLTNVTDGGVYTTPVGTVWNPKYNTDVPSGESMWSTNVIIGGVVILVFFIALAIYYIRIIA